MHAANRFLRRESVALFVMEQVATIACVSSVSEFHSRVSRERGLTGVSSAGKRGISFPILITRGCRNVR